MLNWTQVECFVAHTDDGRTYIIRPNFQKGKQYVALLSLTDGRGRLFEHVVGFFDTIVEAKRTCDNDAKE